MKKISKLRTTIILAVVLIVGVFTSCNNDDDNAPSIVGVWLETSSTTEEFINDVSNGIMDETIADTENFTRLTFNADGTFTNFFSESFNGTVSTSTETGTYTVSDNILSVTYDGETEVEEAEFTLTDTESRFIFEEEYTTTNGDQRRLVITQVFTRQ